MLKTITYDDEIDICIVLSIQEGHEIVHDFLDSKSLHWLFTKVDTALDRTQDPEF